MRISRRPRTTRIPTTTDLMATATGIITETRTATTTIPTTVINDHDRTHGGVRLTIHHPPSTTHDPPSPFSPSSPAASARPLPPPPYRCPCALHVHGKRRSQLLLRRVVLQQAHPLLPVRRRWPLCKERQPLRCELVQQ